MMIPANERGVSLIEVLVSVVLVGLVAAGLIGSLVLIRQGGWRSNSESEMGEYAQRIAEELRTVVTGARADGLDLAPGFYVGSDYQDYDWDPDTAGRQDPANACGATIVPIDALDVSVLNPGLVRFNPRIAYYVEDMVTQVAPNGAEDPNDKTGCSLGAGRAADADGDGTMDLLWTKITIDWDAPTTN
ncbi:MAG: hypothetical protein COV76_00570 [Candidatus Omnitrophica bacterium CG11_big_fil_rev_8_21_14_0_20_64_10]|nr:MAG: hypothetical protein COV76_00570 [Candidatus Omnitrophica bacterium CG11_big_fil_rev_8_21_14_0_20_64_10]